MRIATPKQIKEIDKVVIEEVGIPRSVLVESAAISVVNEIINSMKILKDKNIAVFAGKGNNGEDALAVARHLYSKGANVRIYALGYEGEFEKHSTTNFNIVENLGIPIIEVRSSLQLTHLSNYLLITDVIVDGILGIGINRRVEGFIEETINTINASGKYVISLDIPSGVSGETGEILGTCIKANKTVTFGLSKIGQFLYPGYDYIGQLIISDLSIPPKVFEDFKINTNIIDEEYVKLYFPKRKPVSNKGDYGKVFIIAGSAGMTGAGYLSAYAALRMGAGLVYIGVPASLVGIYETLIPEAIKIPIEDNGTGRISASSTDAIKEFIKGMDVVAIGPGLSVNSEVSNFISDIIKSVEIPMVIDADGLNSIAKDSSILKELKSEVVITPHPGEMGRILGISNKDVQNNRIEIAKEFTKQNNVTTVLKGCRTIIATTDGSLFINPTGNSGLATGGTGDVLTGMLVGLIAQGVKPDNAAVIGAYIHGLTGDMVAREKGEYSLIATDLMDKLPYIIKELTT